MPSQQQVQRPKPRRPKPSDPPLLLRGPITLTRLIRGE